MGDFRQAILERLGMAQGAGQNKQKSTDPRGLQGMLSRGRPVYNGGTNAAQRGPGGPNMGRPATNSLQQAARTRLGI